MTIERANAAVAALAEQVNPRWQPTFHIAPKASWINDPNGLIYFAGRYHAFYQHHPYSPHWGPMHWGHATSTDLVMWEDAGIALAPSIEEDMGGVWSGSAVEHEGKLYVFYTGNRYRNGTDDADGIIQTQCAAVSEDGFTFTKLGAVIAPPEGVEHVRDPKVWKEGDTWHMVLGAAAPTGRGQVWMYTSANLTDWAFDRVIFEDPNPNVWMVECPDLFEVEGRWALVYGPMLKTPERTGYTNRNGHNTGYVLGSWAPGEEFAASHPYRQFDLGHNFYAPQTMLAPDGRRLMFGWMGGFTQAPASVADGWSGCLTVPREVGLLGDHLVTTPARELTALRSDTLDLGSFTLEAGEARTILPDAGPCEIELEADLVATTAEQVCLTVHGQTVVGWDSLAGRVFLDLGRGPGQLGYRSVPFDGDVLRLKVLVDRGSVEVFIGDCPHTLSSLSFPTGSRDVVLSTVSGATSLSLKAHTFE